MLKTIETVSGYQTTDYKFFMRLKNAMNHQIYLYFSEWYSSSDEHGHRLNSLEDTRPATVLHWLRDNKDAIQDYINALNEAENEKD